MNESFITLPKEFWLSNDVSKYCWNCEKSFTAVSRKYHCRYCGLIFCNKCATKNQRAYGGTVLERICENCLVIIKSHKDSLKQMKISLTSSFASDLDNWIEIDEKVLDFCKELQPSVDQKLERALEEFANFYSAALVKNYSLEESWGCMMVKTAKEVVETVCPTVRHRGDKMRITEYVKIVKIESETDACVFFQGGVLKKNIAHKKMPISFKSPKILFLDNRTEHAQIYTMLNVISEDSYLDSLFVKKIKAISPNVVLTTAGLSEVILQELMRNEISVVVNVKYKEFLHLARITNGVILKSVNEGCLLDRFLGSCKKMEVQGDRNKQFVCFTDVEDYTLGGSVILTGKNTKSVEKALKKLIVGMRNAKLERIFLFENGCRLGERVLIEQYTEKIIFKTMQVCKSSVCRDITNGSVRFYTTSDMPLGNFLIFIMQMSEEFCSKCSNPLKEHTTFFFYKQKLLKHWMWKVKSINENDFFISTTCVICHRSIPPHYLSNATWEYSLNKFFWNFFSDSSATAVCEHPFASSVLRFQLGTKQILFKLEEFKRFSVINSKFIKFPLKFYEALLNGNLTELKINVKFILENFRSQVNRLTSKISERVQIFDSFGVKWLKVQENINGLIEEITKVTNNVCQPDMMFDNYLQVESLRRLFFLEYSRLKLEFEDIEKLIKHQKPSKKLSFATKSVKLPTSESYIEEAASIEGDLSERLTKLTSGILTLKPGHSYFVPIYENDSGSIIANALSSSSYNSEISEAIGTNFKDYILDSDTSEWNFVTNSFADLHAKEEQKQNFGEKFSFTTTCFYPKQFHCVRMARHITNDEFVLSLSKTINKLDDVGKSAALFKQTHDSLFILKIVEEKEIKMFNLMAIHYFGHIYKYLYENSDSVLNFCIGAFRVQVKNQTSGKTKMEHLMVFYRIGYGLDGPCVVYDLKGTTNKRRRVKEGDKKTKMDLNFVEDFGTLPLPIAEEDWNVIKRSVVNDSGFLCRCHVVDYSMLLVISLEKKILALGIIDYMQQYTLDKAIESKYKSVVGSQIPTITSPENYKHRFCDKILNHYFMITEE